MKRKIKVTTMGGGTGSYTILSGLKKNDQLDLAAIVSMADDGGSTGRLRDEIGVLPPGDIRQCLVALSEAPLEMRALFNYRFENGGLAGHNFGNIFISTLEKIKGDLNEALSFLKKILKIKGEVIPVTLDNIKLMAKLTNNELVYGEKELHSLPETYGKGTHIKEVLLNKKAKINPLARQTILKSDFIIIGPGNLYCSLIPIFLVEGVKEALKQTKAHIIYLVNLMNHHQHTYNYDVFDFVNKIEEYLDKNIIKTVVFNNKKPSKELLKKYATEGSYTSFPSKSNFVSQNKNFIGADLISNIEYQQNPHDFTKRSFIRHDQEKTAKLLFQIFNTIIE